MTACKPFSYRFVGLAALVLLLAGCEGEIEHYPPDKLYGLVAQRRFAIEPVSTTEASSATELTSATEAVPVSQVGELLEQLYGTPDQPLVPESLQPLLTASEVVRSAGPVGSEESGVDYGLYRKHCAGCHGVDGGGNGPSSSLLSPYPRDFRHGIFKYKRTRRDAKPTIDDLVLTLERGIPGTAMPSFRTVPAEDLKALAQYVIYLSARGETQRRLLDAWCSDEQVASDMLGAANEIATTVAQSWLDAKQAVLQVPAVPASAGGKAWWQNDELIAQGKQLFEGQRANCASCHGVGGQGQIATLDYDDWTKEFTTKLGLAPTDREAMRPFVKAGALPPRRISPRRLDWGVFHGDNSDEALYRRLVAGIAGTPMPGLLVSDGAGSPGVSEAEVWALVAYVRSLSSE